MAQNITLMGASYSDVPAVELPKTGGGTATFTDTSDANAVAADIAQGKTAYVGGQKVTGTASGGGGADQTVEAKLIDSTISGIYENPLVTLVCMQGLIRRQFSDVSLPNCVEIRDSAFRYCQYLESIYIPKGNVPTSNNYAFADCPQLQMLVLPAQTGNLSLTCINDTALEIVDLGASAPRLTNQAFKNCSSLTTLILRKSNIVVLSITNVFDGTPFAADGAGGHIYIPKSLYDHLGDDSSSDYQKASNWSAVHARGTITWHAIEGSQYENYYADGTEVSA